MRLSLGSVIWLLVGVLIASAHHYFAHVGNIRDVVNAVLAVFLWPLILLGISLHVK